MRRVVDAPAEARALGERARRRIATDHSRTAIGERARRRLELIARRRGLPTARPPRADATVGLAAGAEARARSVAYRSLRSCWRLALRVSPKGLHPNLHRLSLRVRRAL
jgi:hypothetical protein